MIGHFYRFGNSRAKNTITCYTYFFFNFQPRNVQNWSLYITLIYLDLYNAFSRHHTLVGVECVRWFNQAAHIKVCMTWLLTLLKPIVTKLLVITIYLPLLKISFILQKICLLNYKLKSYVYHKINTSIFCIKNQEKCCKIFLKKK